MTDPHHPDPPIEIPGQERAAVLLTHLSGLLGAALCFVLAAVGPAIVRRQATSPSVREEARKAFNFNASMTIVYVGVLMVVLLASLLTDVDAVYVVLGFVLIVLAIGWIIEPIRAALRARKGRPSNYPTLLHLMR